MKRTEDIQLKRLLSLAFTLLLASCGMAQSWAHNPQTEARIDALLKQMTLEEKVGQLNQLAGWDDPKKLEQLVIDGQVGSLPGVPPARGEELQRIAVEKSRMKIPLLIGLDTIHGYRTIFPVPLAMASTWEPELVEKSARAAAVEASTEGVRWTFSPMVDIARDARWGRIVESAGEDPYLGAAIARAYVRGYQGKMGSPSSVAACAKHYVGYGAAEAGRDYNTTEIPERLLRQVYLPPFHAAEEEGAATFMSAFNSLNEVPSSANSFTLDQVLRKEWGFRGFVASDWDAVGELISQGVATDKAMAARKALLAGVDMDMESESYVTTLAEQVKSGAVPVAAVDEAVRRILRVKLALGLFEHPYAESVKGPAPTEANLLLARTVAERSFVLLKNEKGVLPLKAEQRVALVGPFADDAAQMLGSWGARGLASDVVTLRAALQQRLGEKLTFAKGTPIIGASDEAQIAEAVRLASAADVVLLTLGEDGPGTTGEATSKTDLQLPAQQMQLLKAVAATGKPVVLLLFSGRPLVLTGVVPQVAAILEVWFPGVQAGPALARTLYGESNPSAKLTVSFPRAVGQEPLYYNHLNTGRPIGNIDDTHPPREGEQFFSRYLDTPTSPLFPFGFGLSYTSFSYGPVSLSATALQAAEVNAGKAKLTVRAEVKNSGAVAGDEVVQLYIGQRGTSITRPVRELKGFRKVYLEAGQSQQVEFTLGRDELAFWNIEMKNVAEPAMVRVWIGGSSDAANPVEFQLK